MCTKFSNYNTLSWTLKTEYTAENSLFTGNFSMDDKKDRRPYPLKQELWIAWILDWSTSRSGNFV